MLKSQEQTDGKSPLEVHAELYEKYKKWGYPKFYIPPMPNTKKLPPGKSCGQCWNFEKGLNCGGSNSTRSYTDYCYRSTNRFTELEPMTVESTPAQRTFAQSKLEEFFGGNEMERLLHATLVRAEYRCECDATICKRHTGRCETRHVVAGGKTVFLLQPKNFKKPHSLENDQVMCAPCANACTINKMSVPKKKRNVKENPNQQTIF